MGPFYYCRETGGRQRVVDGAIDYCRETGGRQRVVDGAIDYCSRKTGSSEKQQDTLPCAECSAGVLGFDLTVRCYGDVLPVCLFEGRMCLMVT